MWGYLTICTHYWLSSQTLVQLFFCFGPLFWKQMVLRNSVFNGVFCYPLSGQLHSHDFHCLQNPHRFVWKLFIIEVYLILSKLCEGQAGGVCELEELAQHWCLMQYLCYPLLHERSGIFHLEAFINISLIQCLSVCTISLQIQCSTGRLFPYVD